jgi:hypothetical protein
MVADVHFVYLGFEISHYILRILAEMEKPSMHKYAFGGYSYILLKVFEFTQTLIAD